MPATITGSQNGTVGLINAATAQNSTSGTAIDFTGIPAGVKRITVMFNGVSTNGSSLPIIQIGSGSFETSGYVGGTQTGASASTMTAGFAIYSASGANVLSGVMQLVLLGSNTWSGWGVFGFSGGGTAQTGGAKTISGTLDRVRITTVNGTDTFDAGSINILYE